MKLQKPPFRLWVGIMIFFSTFQNYMLRANMSVSIVAMAAPKNGTNKTTQCNAGQYDPSEMKYTSSKDVEGKFTWTESEKGDILGAYFYGYLATILLGGPISERIGAFHVIFWTSVGCAIVTGLTPAAAQYGGVGGVMAARAIIGMLGGPVYPAVNNLIAKWSPPEEKGKFLAAMMGNTLGTVTTWIVVGAFPSDMWPWGFYILVIIMAIYLTGFFILVSDTPDKSWFASKEESDYIFASQQGHVSNRKSKPPLLGIFTSCRFWAMVSAQMGNLWCLNLILTFLPKYMKETLGFDLKQSAGLASLPYMMRLIMSAMFGTVGDWMRKEKFMSLSRLRKLFIIFSHFIPAICFFLIYPSGCFSIAVVALLILNQGFNGAVVVSHLVNCQDLSPNFAGTLYGIMNFITMTTGFFVPKITAAILTAYPDDKIYAGSIIFGIGGLALVVFGLLFILFGSAEVQPWNEIKEDEPTQEQNA